MTPDTLRQHLINRSALRPNDIGYRYRLAVALTSAVDYHRLEAYLKAVDALVCAGRNLDGHTWTSGDERALADARAGAKDATRRREALHAKHRLEAQREACMAARTKFRGALANLAFHRDRMSAEHLAVGRAVLESEDHWPASSTLIARLQSALGI